MKAIINDNAGLTGAQRDYRDAVLAETAARLAFSRACREYETAMLALYAAVRDVAAARGRLVPIELSREVKEEEAE